jgi:hypothetical protein
MLYSKVNGYVQECVLARIIQDGSEVDAIIFQCSWSYSINQINDLKLITKMAPF